MLNTSYLIWMACSVLAVGGVHYLISATQKKRAALVGLCLLFGTVLGVVFAKVGYFLLQMEYAVGYGFQETFLSDDMSMMSFYCGMLGVILGVIAAARLTGNRPLDALNVYAPAGALLASLARFGEHFLGMTCVGNYIESETFCFFPLAVGNEWGEWYLAVHIYGGLLYLVIAAVSLWKFKRHRFLRTLFYLCLVQVFCESLRNQSLIWSQFIRVEQLICMIVVEAILILFACWSKEKKRFVPAVTGLLCAGVFVAVEFAVGGKLFDGVSPVIFYAVMIAGLAVLAVMENWLVRHLAK